MAKSKKKTVGVKASKSSPKSSAKASKAAKPPSKGASAKSSTKTSKSKSTGAASKKAKVTQGSKVKGASKSKASASDSSKPLKTLVKAVAKVLGKAGKSKKSDEAKKETKKARAGKGAEPETEVLEASSSAESSTTKSKKEKTSQKSAQKAGKKPGKKKGEDFDMDEEDLLAGDDDLGAEEIPDLSEFEEDEIEETEEESSESEESPSSWMSAPKSDSDEVILTDAEGRKYCRVRDCDQAAVVESYCRYHYLLLWKKIQVRRKILQDGKLERYVEELTSRYPDKFLEMIRKDLRSEKDFLSAIAELEIDESVSDGDYEDETQSFIDEVRGMSGESAISDDDEF